VASNDREAIAALASRVRAGDRRSLSRAISWIEDQTADGRALLDELYQPAPRAHRVGITGPPGSGKSSLVSELTRLLRVRGSKVGVLAVDPSSPFTGGAILGDRIRMQAHHGDPGVFIRSMASRGSLGGLASTTYEASEAMEAFGCEWILIETVGVGQSEMEIIEAADTTVLVLVPESGDAVQVMKAGLMEAGQVFVINKSDREGGDRLEKEISLLFELVRDRRPGVHGDQAPPAWEPRIFRTVATSGEGVLDLLAGIDAHRDRLRADPVRWRVHCETRTAARLRGHLRDRLLHGIWSEGQIDEWLDDGLRRIRAGQVSPYALVDDLVERLLRGSRLARAAVGDGGGR
jgi:LAO/AO transport system kinase